MDARTRSIIELIYGLATDLGRWPTYSVVDIRLDRQLQIEDSQAALKSMPARYLVGTRNSFGYGPEDSIRLTLRGVAECTAGRHAVALLLRFVEFAVNRERDPSLGDVPTFEVRALEFAEHVGLSLGSDEVWPGMQPTPDLELARQTLLRVPLLADPLRTFNSWSNEFERQWRWAYNINRQQLRIYRGVNSIESLLDLVEPLDSEPEASPALAEPTLTPAPLLDSAPTADLEFDIAVSFAGEDRGYVQQLVDQLKDAEVRVFYDEDYKADSWGQNLVEYFDSIYGKRTRYVLMFISHHYASKTWTRLERRSALAKGLASAEPYVLPIRLDDTELPGLQSTVGYMDTRYVSIAEIVAAVLRKLERTPPVAPPTIDRVPRTEPERQRLLLERPSHWEYLYFAALLLHERDLLAERYRDHQICYGEPTGTTVNKHDVAVYTRDAINEIVQRIQVLDQLNLPEVQQRAFGALGESGDPENIAHFAKRWNGVYDGMLSWAARLRGTNGSDECRDVLLALASTISPSIESYRNFVDQTVIQMDRIPALAESEEVTRVSLVLDLDIDDESMAAYLAALKRATDR